MLNPTEIQELFRTRFELLEMLVRINAPEVSIEKQRQMIHKLRVESGEHLAVEDHQRYDNRFNEKLPE